MGEYWGYNPLADLFTNFLRHLSRTNQKKYVTDLWWSKSWVLLTISSQKKGNIVMSWLYPQDHHHQRSSFMAPPSMHVPAAARPSLPWLGSPVSFSHVSVRCWRRGDEPFPLLGPISGRTMEQQIKNREHMEKPGTTISWGCSLQKYLVCDDVFPKTTNNWLKKRFFPFQRCDFISCYVKNTEGDPQLP